MKQNPTIPAVLEPACRALESISENPENQVIAGAAGAVQVLVSASSYPTSKKKDTLALLYSLHLFLLYLTPSMVLSRYIWCSTFLFGSLP